MTRPVFVLAHGAGVGQAHPFMQDWQARLAQLGTVVPFEYPYMAMPGKRPPDRLPKLLARHREALQSARTAHPGAPVFLIGKSMGSRVGCHLANEPDLAGAITGVICLGYPLQSPTTLRDEVLVALRVPILFVQGTRDHLCPLELLESVRARMSAPNALHVVAGGDHTLHLRVKDTLQLGTSQAAADEAAWGAVTAFVAGGASPRWP